MPKNTAGFTPVMCYIMIIQGNVWYHQQLLLSSPSIQGTHFHQGHLRPGATDRLAPVGILLLLLLIMVQVVLLLLINLSSNFCSSPPVASSSLSLLPPSFSLSWPSSTSSRSSILIQGIIQKGNEVLKYYFVWNSPHSLQSCPFQLWIVFDPFDVFSYGPACHCGLLYKIHCILATLHKTRGFGDDLIQATSTTGLPIIYMTPILGTRIEEYVDHCLKKRWNGSFQTWNTPDTA